MMFVYIRGLQGKDERSDAVAERSEVNPAIGNACALSAEDSKGKTSEVMR